MSHVSLYVPNYVTEKCGNKLWSKFLFEVNVQNVPKYFNFYGIFYLSLEIEITLFNPEIFNKTDMRQLMFRTL